MSKLVFLRCKAYVVMEFAGLFSGRKAVESLQKSRNCARESLEDTWWLLCGRFELLLFSGSYLFEVEFQILLAFVGFDAEGVHAFGHLGDGDFGVVFVGRDGADADAVGFDKLYFGLRTVELYGDVSFGQVWGDGDLLARFASFRSDDVGVYEILPENESVERCYIAFGWL